MTAKRIHITGASGSGTTTLGKVLAERYNYHHLDSDGYFWFPTEPPYQKIRDINERQKLLQKDLLRYQNWVSTGSICGWGDFAIKYFDLVVFLFVSPDIRIHRLFEREKIRSPESFIEGTERAEQFEEFIYWAKRYDKGGMEVRSLYLHNQWLQGLNCPVLKIEGEISIAESVERIERF